MKALVNEHITLGDCLVMGLGWLNSNILKKLWKKWGQKDVGWGHC